LSLSVPVVAVPFHGFEQLRMAEAGSLETIAEGTAELPGRRRSGGRIGCSGPRLEPRPPQ
jgi:hypothetical protein